MSPAGKTSRNGPHYKRAVENIKRAMTEARVSQKEVCEYISMTESVFSQKLRGTRSHFYEDEMERVAMFFRRSTRRPLTGFPHLDWQLMEGIDRRLFGWKP